MKTVSCARGIALCALVWASPAWAEEQPGASRSGPNLHSVLSNMPSPDAKPMATEPLAGYIFGQPVPLSNYYFAKRVAYVFPRPWERRLSAKEREQVIWEALILHFESFRRGITVSDQELEAFINRVLQEHGQVFARGGDHAAYAAWVQDVVGEDLELFENQMRYYRQIEKLREEVQRSFPVTVTDEEMREEFLNEKNHVGGELVLLPTKEEADALYARVKTPGAWEAEKQKDPAFSKPFGLITLEAVMDLWGLSKEQAYAFHALEPGTVAAPMPFGGQWAVLRLTEKRVGDLAQFPPERDQYHEQLKTRKRYEALKRWIEALKVSAKLRILPPE